MFNFRLNFLCHFILNNLSLHSHSLSLSVSLQNLLRLPLSNLSTGGGRETPERPWKGFYTHLLQPLSSSTQNLLPLSLDSAGLTPQDLAFSKQLLPIPDVLAFSLAKRKTHLLLLLVHRPDWEIHQLCLLPESAGQMGRCQNPILSNRSHLGRLNKERYDLCVKLMFFSSFSMWSFLLRLLVIICCDYMLLCINSMIIDEKCAAETEWKRRELEFFFTFPFGIFHSVSPSLYIFTPKPFERSSSWTEDCEDFFFFCSLSGERRKSLIVFVLFQLL